MVTFTHNSKTYAEFDLDNSIAVKQLLEDGVPKTVIDDIRRDRAKQDRYRRLEHIWNKKTVGLKSLAIDKPYMNTVSAISNQYEVYQEMYLNAKKGIYEDSVNLEIITINEATRAQLAPLVLLLNSVRSKLEDLIETDAKDVDAMLDRAEAITLTKYELTSDKLSEIKKVFGV